MDPPKKKGGRPRADSGEDVFAHRQVRRDLSGVPPKTARDLLRQFEALISSEARKLARRSRNSPWFGFEDFVAVGQIAAVEAYVLYKPEAKVTLKTWVRRIVQWRMREAAQRVSDPLGVISAMRSVARKFASGDASEEEYQQAKARAEHFAAYCSNPVWVDAPLYPDSEGEPVNFHEILPDHNQNIEEVVAEAQQFQAVSDAIKTLSIREQMVLHSDLQEQSGRSLGEELGVSRQRVAYYRKIGRQALARLLSEQS